MISTVRNVKDIYQVADRLKADCRKHNELELHDKLDNALQLGSSGLEMIGAIGKIISENHKKIRQISDMKIDDVLVFIKKAYQG